MDGLLNDLFFDPDLDNRFMVKNIYAPLIIVIPYLLFIKSWGPRFMKNRPPYTLQTILIVYNFILVLGNAYLCYYFVNISWVNRSQWCGLKHNPDFLTLRNGVRIAAWHIYLIKYLELLDTVFFVLRKKMKQVTFLHIFHHGFVPIVGRYILSSHAIGFYMVLIAMINSFVHVVMYTYYGLAAIGPHMQKYLWWKKYLTWLQICQFVFLAVYLIIAALTGCESMDATEAGMTCLLILFVFLFGNFYRNTFKAEQLKEE